MRPGALAEDVTQLAWVAPTAPALLALARGAPGAWREVRRDPGAVLLLLRMKSVSRLLPDNVALPDLIESPEPLLAAADHLRRYGEASLIDWSDPRRAPILDACRRHAHLAHTLAAQTGCADPDRAWVSGLLAGLGWIAVAAHSPAEASACQSDPTWSADPADAERRRWGLDQSELARRLARRWELPAWVAAVIGHLGLPPDVAIEMGAEPGLFQVTQLAVGLVRQQGGGLGLPVGAAPAELLRALHLNAPFPGADADTDCPFTPLSLSEFLDVEAEKRRLQAQGAARPLEAELDILHRALEAQRGREAEHLRVLKLRALAEFAGGAGHEINNPLAVISGQAQYLRGHENEPARREALEKIIGQTQRIHTLLRGLMQFARPPAPTLRPVDLVRLVDEVATALADHAREHQVRLKVREDQEGRPPVAPPPCMILADAGQLKAALTGLVRNAIEAAGADGWVRVRVMETGGWVEVVVEDSGPPMPTGQREHLFDPFYSGRAAGRGTGLGLPTAWSLARQHGGDVFLASEPGEPTRFVLRLPLPAERNAALAC